MNKLVTTLSIITVLSASNVSFASGGDVTRLSHYAGQIPTELNFTKPSTGEGDGGIDIKFGGFGTKDKTELGEGDAQNKDSYSTLLKFQSDYEQSRLQFNYIFGLYLDFGDGKLSIENLEEEMQNKVKACKQKEKTAFENGEEDEVNKLLARTTREVWEKVAKAVSADKKRLLEKKTTIENLRDKCTEIAMGWFSSQYGVKNKKESSHSDSTSNKKSQEPTNKYHNWR
jgi:hypothetical protein